MCGIRKACLVFVGGLAIYLQPEQDAAEPGLQLLLLTLEGVPGLAMCRPS